MASEAKTKAFFYLRRSQDRGDRQELSIEGQKAELRPLIEKHNLAPIWLTPESKSAHHTGRPVFDDMCKAIERGEARVIVVWSANRLARNAKDGGTLIHYLHEGRLLKIITPTRTYSTAIMEDHFFLQLEFGMSKMYSDEISKNVKRGNRVKIENGEYPSHAPLGYINDKRNGRKNIFPDPESADKVTETFRYASTGKYTLDEVYKHARDVLNLRSKKGNEISKATINDMLRNSLYFGWFLHGGSYHQGVYETLVDRDLFEKVQVAMGWKGKRRRNSSRGVFFPYKQVFACSVCGHNLTAYVKKKKLKKSGEVVDYEYYTCTKKSRKIKCRDPQISSSELEDQVLEYLSQIEITKEDSEQCIKLLRRFHNELVESNNTRLDDWRKRQKELEKKQSRILDMRMNEELSSDEFKSEKYKVSSDLARTTELINDVHTNADAWLETAEEFFTGAVSLVDVFKVATDEEKRALAIEIGSNWELGNKKVLFTPRKPYDLLVNRTDSSNWRARPDLNRRSPP